MRTLHTPDGDIGIYNENIGSPCLKVGRYYMPMTAISSRYASRIRIKQGYAVSLLEMFNFKRVLAKIERDLTDIVFRRYNGEEMFRLKLAGNGS